MSLNEEIRNRRVALGLSQTELARELNVSIITIFRWEKGIYSPKLHQLTALAKLFNVKEQDLIDSHEHKVGT